MIQVRIFKDGELYVEAQVADRKNMLRLAAVVDNASQFEEAFRHQDGGDPVFRTEVVQDGEATQAVETTGADTGADSGD